MNLYLLIVFVHIAAAVALLSGSVLGSPTVRAAVRRAGTTQEIRAYLAIGRPLAVLEPMSALVVLASGVYLASVAHFWSLGWVQVAAAFWLVNAVTAGTLVTPALGRVAAEAANAVDGPVGQQLDALRWSALWSFGGDLLVANDATMLFLMTMKPGLAGSLLAVGVANAAVISARLFYRFRPLRVAAGGRASAGDPQPQLTTASSLAAEAVAPVYGAGGEFIEGIGVSGKQLP